MSTVMQGVWIAAFAGHRDVSNPKEFRTAVERELRWLIEQVTRQTGALQFYSSIAEGADIEAVELAHRLQLPVHLILPLPTADFRADFVGPSEWARAEKQIHAAQRGTHGGTLRVAESDFVRPNCYFDASAQMLRSCDVLIAFWDGQPSRGLGGTQQTVQMARALKKPLIWIHSATGQVARENFPAEWPAPDPLFAELDYSASRKGRSLGGALGKDTQALHGELDEVANAHAPRFRRAASSAMILHTAAAVVASVAVCFAGELSHLAAPALALAELLMVLAALWLIWNLHSKHTREHWLKARFGAELVRSLRATQPLLDPLRPLIQQHAPEWNRFAVTVGLAARREFGPEHSLEGFKRRYLSDRLREQEGYFARQATHAAKVYSFCKKTAVWCSLAAPVFVGTALLNKLAHLGWEATVPGNLAVRLLPLVLPLAAATASGLQGVLDSVRRNHRYPEMAHRLATTAVELEALQTPASVAQAVEAVEEVLLDELTEWHLVAKTAEAH
ncbi:MAG: hypothetical protein HY301_06690 [Verrucomicrobia bacterium]|nr:hypothetical protein [Verrucomicrobiota bacterium]